jgi:hypothetical protein
MIDWSPMTAVCGVTLLRITLSLARIAVGVGEAGAQPALVPLIGEYFEPRASCTLSALIPPRT